MRSIALVIIAGVAVFLVVEDNTHAAEPGNLNDLPNDLMVPVAVGGEPRAGARVWQKNRGYEDWEVAHALYLPTDWKPEGQYPVIFEYPGNGNFQNALGDKSDGTVEGCQMGYGLSGGKGMIWVSLPFVDPATKAHARQWWGDAEATAKYCRLTTERICREYGGDPRKLVLCGFSRGAIAGNYIGLRDDEIAKLWRAFMLHSHYDGVRRWNYPESDADSALARLRRLGDRPQFISHEMTTEAVESYLQAANASGKFTFAALPYRNHSSAWVLKDVPLRAQARQWLERALSE
jgi:acetyl esterase/lipase